MNINQPVNVQVLTRQSFRRPESLLAFMHFFEDTLPFLKPSVFNWTDPVDKPWDLNEASAYFPADRRGEADSIYWLRKKAPKASGYFGVARPVNTSPYGRWHGELSFVTERDDVDDESLTRYIRDAVLKFEGDLAQVHWVCQRERPLRELEYQFDMAGANGGSEFATSALLHWLPLLPWAMVFGKPYVDMFGMERLLSAPAHLVEQLSESAAYIQLSPRLTDLESDYDEVHAVRLRVQAHLGERAFFDPERAYPLRSGAFLTLNNIPLANTVRAIAEFKVPVPGTNGFQVPDFSLSEV